MARCFQVNSADNVATMLDDVELGVVEVLGSGSVEPERLRTAEVPRTDSGESERLRTGDVLGTDSGESMRLGTAAAPGVNLTEPIKLGHKVALCDIGVGEAVVKFGVPIGRASAAIKAGQWVHLHNCASFLDERSQTLDVHSGAVTDTVYE